jgi:hypothetical protein
MTTPIASSNIPRKIALPRPSFLPMLGANKEKTANVIRLRVVKNPAAPLDIPRSSRIKGINGPTEAMDVRRLMEINTTPRIRRALEEGLDKGGLKYEVRETLEIRSTRYEIRKLKLMSNVER